MSDDAATVGLDESFASGPKRRHPVIAIAHRGGSSSAPENTLAAFAAAERAGADMIELATTELIARFAAEGCVTRIMGSNALSIASVGAGRAVAVVIGSFGAGDCLGGS
jgi:fructose-1,6-bisphosphatase/inositol monophosphatase family enzyme